MNSTTENSKGDQFNNNSKNPEDSVNVTAYMGSQPIIGGIKPLPKENKFPIKIKFTKNNISIFLIIIGSIMLLSSVLGYLYFSGFFTPKESEPITVNPTPTPIDNKFSKLTFPEKQMPQFIGEDQIIMNISNINSTISIEDTLSRFLNLQISEFNAEIKTLTIEPPLNPE